MFSRTKRLTTDAFDSVFKTGRSVHFPFFNIRFVKNDTDKRFAVAISKKVIKSSVGRHLLKRQIMNLLKKEESELPSGHFIFFVKKELMMIDKKEFKSVLKDSLKNVCASFSR